MTAAPAGPDLLLLVAHGGAEPAFATHALHLAGAAAALGDSVGLYFAGDGVSWLLAEPAGAAGRLAELAEAGVAVYACPGSLTDHGVTPALAGWQRLGAAAAVELAHAARLVLSL